MNPYRGNPYGNHDGPDPGYGPGPNYGYDSGYVGAGGPAHEGFDWQCNAMPPTQQMQHNPEDAYIQSVNEQIAYLRNCIKILEQQNRQLHSNINSLRKVLNSQLRRSSGRDSGSKSSGGRSTGSTSKHLPAQDTSLASVGIGAQSGLPGGGSTSGGSANSGEFTYRTFTPPHSGRGVSSIIKVTIKGKPNNFTAEDLAIIKKWGGNRTIPMHKGKPIDPDVFKQLEEKRKERMKNKGKSQSQDMPKDQPKGAPKEIEEAKPKEIPKGVPKENPKDKPKEVQKGK